MALLVVLAVLAVRVVAFKSDRQQCRCALSLCSLLGQRSPCSCVVHPARPHFPRWEAAGLRKHDAHSQLGERCPTDSDACRAFTDDTEHYGYPERAEGPPTLWSSIGRQLFRSQRVPHTLKYERAARVCSSASSTPLLLNNALRRKKFANTAQFFL